MPTTAAGSAVGQERTLLQENNWTAAYASEQSLRPGGGRVIGVRTPQRGPARRLDGSPGGDPPRRRL